MLELLAAVCLVRGGHDIILAAFDNFKEVSPQQRHTVPTLAPVLRLGLCLSFPVCGRARKMPIVMLHPLGLMSQRQVHVPRATSQLGWVPGSILPCHPLGCPPWQCPSGSSALCSHPRFAGRRTASRS